MRELTQIEADFAAITVEGLELAFVGRREITLSGALPNGSRLTRRVWVCGPGAFVVLKAMAFHLRGEKKVAYDLSYTLREIPVDDVLTDFLAFPRNQRTVVKALAFLLECDAELDFAGDLLRAEGKVAAEEAKPRYVANYIGSKQKVVDWIWNDIAMRRRATREAVEFYRRKATRGKGAVLLNLAIKNDMHR